MIYYFQGKMIRVLVVEKDIELKRKIESALKVLGYTVVFSSSTKEAYDFLLSTKVQMILSDYDDGAIELCKMIRSSRLTTPFITLIENPMPRDKRKIFRSMADGYLEKPFDMEELSMRIQNLLWRCNIETSVSVEYGNTVLHSDTFTLEIEDRVIELRKLEFLLLEKLLSYPGRIFTRKQLMDDLWGYDCTSDPRTVDTHIRLLRKKLKKEDSIRIQTIRGIGYRAAVPKNK